MGTLIYVGSFPGAHAVGLMAAAAAILFLAGLGIATAGDVAPTRAAAGGRPWPLLAPGALSGWRFIVTLVVASTLLAARQATLVPGEWRTLPSVVGMAGYVLLYLGAGIALARGLPWKRLAAPDATRATVVALVGIGCLLPLLLAVAVGRSPDDTPLNLLNPLVTVPRLDHTWRADDRMAEATLIAALGAAFAVLADRALATRARRLARETVIAKAPG